MQRREFIKAGAAAVAMPAILKAAAADQKIRMGFIGVGRYNKPATEQKR